MFTLGKVRAFWAVLKIFFHYGPDLATFISRDLGFDEISKEAGTRWVNEGMHLLPRQYKIILSRLHETKIINDDAYTRYRLLAFGSIWASGLTHAAKLTGNPQEFLVEPAPFPWDDDPFLLTRVEGSLSKRIEEFRADHAKFTASARGAFVLSSLLSPP